MAIQALILFSFASLALASQGSTCARYTWASPEQGLESNQCAIGFQQNTYIQYYVQPCASSSLECPKDSGTVPVTCTTVSRQIALPGMQWSKSIICNLDQDTGSNKHCEDGIWIGLGKGSDCYSSDQCEVGLYCSTTCVDQLESGATCSSDIQCQNNYVCNGNNKCVLAYDIEDGDPCTISTECESGLCEVDGEKAIDMHCYSLKSENDTPHKCLGPQDCPSKKFKSKTTGKEGSIYSSCECGMNANGDQYCKLFNNDYYAQIYHDILKDWYHDKDILKCNTMARNSNECKKTYMGYSDYEEFIYYQQQTINFVELANAESCVLETFYREFEDADDEIYDDDFTATLLLPFFFGLL